jgi:hypothetical protein
MTLLCFLGMEGNGMSNRKGRSVFRVSNGTLGVYRDRAVKAILDCLYDDYVKWPDPDERRFIAERIRAEFGLPNCIGIADGTLLPLAFRPSTDDYADYKGSRRHQSPSSSLCRLMPSDVRTPFQTSRQPSRSRR